MRSAPILVVVVDFGLNRFDFFIVDITGWLRERESDHFFLFLAVRCRVHHDRNRPSISVNQSPSASAQVDGHVRIFLPDFDRRLI